MNYTTQSNQTNQKKVMKSEQAEKAFAYNILIPDFAIFVIGVAGGFATLLAMFS